MYCKQTFAIILNEDIKNEIVCSSYQTASEIAKANYDKDAFAVESTYYGVGIGDKYKNGTFYTKGGEIAEYYGDQEENINMLKDKTKTQEQQIELQKKDINDLADMIIEIVEA